MSISGGREPGIVRVNPTPTPRQPRAVGRTAFFERRSEYKERPRAIFERQKTLGFIDVFATGEYKESPRALWSAPGSSRSAP